MLPSSPIRTAIKAGKQDLTEQPAAKKARQAVQRKAREAERKAVARAIEQAKEFFQPVMDELNQIFKANDNFGETESCFRLFAFPEPIPFLLSDKKPYRWSLAF